MKVKLGDIYKVSSGGTPSKSHQEYYADGDIKWVKTGDLKVRYLYETEDYITEEGLNNSSAKMYAPDTVLIAMYGATIGATSILKTDACTNQACAAFPKSEDVIPEYLYYFFRSQKDKFVKDGVGGAQPNISGGYLKNVSFELISIDEQKEVIHRLGLIEDIISQRQKQLVLLNELIKSRFIEMFGNAVTNPMNWEVKELGELSTHINSGNTPKGGEQVYVDEGIMFFRSQNVWKDRLELDDVAYIDASTHASMSRSSLKHGDILMTKTGRINTENSSLGRAAMYLGEDDAANVNGHVYFIRLKPGVNNRFILRILVSDEYRGYIRSVCVGGIDKRQLNKNHIEEFPIICPPIEMQNKYISFVEQIDKQKVILQQSLTELETQFQALMHEAFNS
ncbi:MAG: restriction endonuclease subunit S [bacterium]|nr:restriction endonuclease subunit S [bacterium]